MFKEGYRPVQGWVQGYKPGQGYRPCSGRGTEGTTLYGGGEGGGGGGCTGLHGGTGLYRGAGLYREGYMGTSLDRGTGLYREGYTVASEGDNSRGGAKGDAPGRVREGGHPSRPARGYGGAL